HLSTGCGDFVKAGNETTNSRAVEGGDAAEIEDDGAFALAQQLLDEAFDFLAFGAHHDLAGDGYGDRGGIDWVGVKVHEGTSVHQGVIWSAGIRNVPMP